MFYITNIVACSVDILLKQLTTAERDDKLVLVVRLRYLFGGTTWGLNNCAHILFCTKLWFLARKINSMVKQTPVDSQCFIASVYLAQLGFNGLATLIFFCLFWNIDHASDKTILDIGNFIITVPALVSFCIMVQGVRILQKVGYFAATNQINKAQIFIQTAAVGAMVISDLFLLQLSDSVLSHATKDFISFTFNLIGIMFLVKTLVQFAAYQLRDQESFCQILDETLPLESDDVYDSKKTAQLTDSLAELRSSLAYLSREENLLYE